jgi:hypothetical protein
MYRDSNFARVVPKGNVSNKAQREKRNTCKISSLYLFLE